MRLAQGRTQEFEKGVSSWNGGSRMDNRDTYAQNFKLLTLGAHVPDGYSTVCIVAPRAIRCRNSSSSDFRAIRA